MGCQVVHINMTSFDEIRNLGVHELSAYNGYMSIHITTIPPFEVKYFCYVELNRVPFNKDVLIYLRSNTTA